MTPDLNYLAWTAMLTAVLWIPYISGQVLTNGFLTPKNYRDPTANEVPLWGQRANRAHINAVESFAPFAALVLVAHVGGVSNEATAMWAAVFFWARLAHAVVYVLGIPFLRTIIFTAGFVAVAGIFYQIVM
jgi:uncharacterized MAPEG superfamily protein